MTISALAATDAELRGIMTAGLAVSGACHIVTACAMRSAAPAGRLCHALGGIATIGVAAFPLTGGEAADARHAAAAAVAFGALALWPALSRNDTSANPAVRGRVPVLAASVLCMLVLLLFGALLLDSPVVGAVERVVAAALALWPLAVMVNGSLRTAPARCG